MNGWRAGAFAAIGLLVAGVTAFGLIRGWSAGSQLNASAQLEDDQVTLHFMINGTEGADEPNRQDFIMAAIEKKFNVRLRLTAIEPGEAYNETIASLLAANDPPDMWLNINADGGVKYTMDNVLADMTYYVTPQTMPNYFQYWVDEQELREYQTNNQFARAPIPFDRKSYRAYYIRRDWLTHLGMDIPRSYDEYLEVLRAFTYNDPDNNGKNDTYGFITSGNGSGISLDWPEYIQNGLLYPAYFADDQLIDMQMDLRVGQVVDDILLVMDEGIVDPNWFLNKGNQHVDKAVHGKAGVILGDTSDFALDSNPDSLQTRSRKFNTEADWIPFNPFGQQPLRIEPSPEYPFVFSNITAGAAPEKLMLSASILDWLAGKEGFLLTHYGLEGKHYTLEGNTVFLHPEALEAGEEELLKKWSFFTPKAPEVLGLQVNDPRMTERDERVLQAITNMPVYEKLGTTLTPPLGVSVEAMRAKQNEWQVKMMFSDKSGKRWPEYRQDVMSNYKGNEIFQQFEEKIRLARKRLAGERR
ncbi:hypothetical protein [Paenibacillus sp. GXUN7292]|uniref:hypothetical protein n=1 Tax=Paenibacillus sp. GXUN7292 TaxID=3422499 RepID=UPI003D7E3BAB